MSVKIVAKISDVHDVKDISMTTNGTLLEKYAEKLYDNGLIMVNVNIPTLKREV